MDLEAWVVVTCARRYEGSIVSIVSIFAPKPASSVDLDGAGQAGALAPAGLIMRVAVLHMVGKGRRKDESR